MSNHLLLSSHRHHIPSTLLSKPRSTSVLRLKKSSPFKITLNKQNHNEKSNNKVSVLDFKNILKVPKGFAPRIQYNHINPQELLDLVSNPKGATKVDSRLNHINTLRKVDDNSLENSISSSHRGILSPPMSPQRLSGSAQFSIANQSFQQSDFQLAMTPPFHEKEHKFTKLKRNGFVSHLRGSFSMGGNQSWCKHENELYSDNNKALLKPNKSYTRYNLNPFIVKKQGSATSRDFIQTRNQERGSLSGQEDFSQASVSKVDFAKSTKEILTRRTASIPSLNRNSFVSLEIVLKKCPIRAMNMSNNIKFEKPNKPKTSVDSRRKQQVIKIEEHKETNYIRNTKLFKEKPVPRTNESKNKNQQGEKYEIKGFDTLLNDLKDEEEMKSKRNKSNFSVFQVSTVGDHSSSHDQIHL